MRVVIKEIVLAESDDGAQITEALQRNARTVQQKMTRLTIDFIGPAVMHLAERIVFQPKDSESEYVIKDRGGLTGWMKKNR